MVEKIKGMAENGVEPLLQVFITLSDDALKAQQSQQWDLNEVQDSEEALEQWMRDQSPLVWELIAVVTGLKHKSPSHLKLDQAYHRWHQGVFTDRFSIHVIFKRANADRLLDWLVCLSEQGAQASSFIPKQLSALLKRRQEVKARLQAPVASVKGKKNNLKQAFERLPCI